jgi:hypothetical protein
MNLHLQQQIQSSSASAIDQLPTVFFNAAADQTVTRGKLLLSLRTCHQGGQMALWVVLPTFCSARAWAERNKSQW